MASEEQSPTTPDAQPDSSTSPPAESSTSTQPLSKNAQKKLAKAARFAEVKKERRAAEKARRKEKRRQQAQQRDAEEATNEDGGPENRKKRKVEDQKAPRVPFNARVVVDLGFDDMMTENEIKSLTSQLAFTYSANRKAERPFASVLFTSLNGRTFDRLEAISDAAYRRWVDSEWWQESYERLWEGSTEQSEGGAEVQEAQQSTDVTDGGKPTADRRRKIKRPQTAEKESVVYLTADADEELMELKENETYIIGGICDHNRYKNLCLNKSRTSGIRAARLPIGTYLSTLKTRKVLTVNQTFEILLKWVETRDWEKALWAVIPQRKFQEGKRSGKSGKESAHDDTEEGEPERVVLDVQTLEGEDEEANLNDFGVASQKADAKAEAIEEGGPADDLTEKTWTTMDPDDNAEVPQDSIPQ